MIDLDNITNLDSRYNTLDIVGFTKEGSDEIEVCRMD